MSYSEMKAFAKDGSVICLEEFPNSHYLVVVWRTIAEKYRVTYELFGNMKPVWDLQYNPDVSSDDWYCLMFTFDKVVVPPELIERVAQAFDHFVVDDNLIDHGKGFARCMREAARDIDGIRGIALYGTSICDDPFDSVPVKTASCQRCGGPITLNAGHEPWCEKCDDYVEGEYEDYNLDKHNKHWFLPPREEWLAQHKQRQTTNSLGLNG
jgi:hypothetical protein